MPWMPVYLAIIFIFHPLLGWLAVGGSLIIATLVLLNELSVRAPMGELAQLSARRTDAVAAAKRNAEVVSAMGMLKALTGRWEADNLVYQSVQQRAADRASTFGTAIKAFRFMLQSAVLGLGAWLAIRQEVSPGIMIAASIITARALAPVEQAVANWRGFVGARQARGRLTRVFEASAATEPETVLPPPSRTLVVERLATAAPGEHAALVQGVTFRLQAGDGLGIIGPSGSGKTCLLRALVGVWPPVRGSIRLDGAEYSQWERTAIGRSIGYLPQDVELFDGSIADNIARFDPDRSSESVLEAARLAGVHDLVKALPEGFDTMIGEGGARLSAGQRQRVGLARALYRAPFLLALDEPNSNLDGEGEAALSAAVQTMRAKGSIVIVVAHRASAIAAVDKLLYIKEGQQVAFGPKDAVLAKINQLAGQAAPSGPGPTRPGGGGPLKVVKTDG
ncbi:type I secretion system permease/ATPase [Breoghania sp. L-A4]|uniref:type I secretion system permease/ATPase n=1 Tax=Breoghania sp. L-A4 TaxID=2304600 RepID=UPI0032047400